jgi:hypothetical protein
MNLKIGTCKDIMIFIKKLNEKLNDIIKVDNFETHENNEDNKIKYIYFKKNK